MKAFAWRTLFEELEPRLLFSAGVEGALLEQPAPPPAAPFEAAYELVLKTPAPTVQESNEAEHVRHELVVIDPRTSAYQQLLDDLASRDGARHIEVVVLDAARDGVEQLTELLAARAGIGAMHLISHGEAGAVTLGSGHLNFDSLVAGASRIAGWADAFAEDGDLLIYGCNLAASADGRALVDSLARLTGADVAASDNITGHTAFGGDWDLEFATGRIETHTVVSQTIQEKWFGLLDVTSLQANQDTYIKLKSPDDVNNFGAATSLVIDRETTDLERALLQFDLSGVPVGSTINGATLKLQSTQIGGTLDIDVYEVTEAWSEGTGDGIAGVANWNLRQTGTNWTTAGGTFDATAVATLNTGSAGQHTWNVTSLVQSWFNGTKINNGLMVASPPRAGNLTVTYDSREGTAAPVLEIDYTPPAMPQLDLDANDSGAATGANYTAQYRIAGGILSLADVDATIADTDSTMLSSLTATITNLPDGASETLTADTTGTSITASYNSGTGVLALSGADSVGNYQRVLRTVAYQNSASTPDRSDRTITFVADDGTGSSNVGTATVHWDYVRDDFAPNAYSGNDGSANWSTDWIEYNDDGNAAAGSVQATGNALNRTIPVLLGDGAKGAMRGVDLTGANSAALSFAYRVSTMAILANTDVRVEVSDNGGAGWTTVLSSSSGTLLISDTGWRTASVDISAYATANTRIRLVADVTGLTIGGSAQFDDVEVCYDAHGAAPALDLDADDNSGATGADFAASFIEGTAAVVTDGNDAVVSDADSTTLTELVATIVNPLDGALESLSANTAGTSITASYDGTTGALTLAGADTLARYRQVLRTVTYDNISQSPNTTARIITFQASDGVDHSSIAVTTVTVAAVNDAPVLDTNRSPAMSALNEDSGAPSGAVGTLVSALVDFASPAGQVDNVTDADSGALPGIAVTAADATSGTWWYSTDNGANWNALGAVNDSGARLLAADASTRICFQPNADYNGTMANAITFRAWDRSSGTNGTLADTSTNGGSTAFSTATDTASLTVTAVNDAPVITSDGGGATTGVSVAENSTPVTTVTASDPDVPGQSLSYAIAGGADAFRFNIDSTTGELAFLAPPDYETPSDADANNVYEVTVQVSDGNGGMDTQAIAVTVTNLNETPVVNNQSFAINENTPNGTSVGAVAASDPDAGDSLTYSITAGNTNGAFTINAGTGEITVANSTALDFETTPVFNLTVQVEDNGTLTDTATVTINLNDLNETPAVNNQSFAIDENSANGTSVGTVLASDPDAGDALTYSITAGNTDGAFTINAGTGEITVANSAALDFETTPVFNLTVQIEDSGTLTDTATVTINLNDLNETPAVNNQGFAVNENAGNGTSVGTVAASDPDAGDSLTYSITAGNTGGTFTINAGTGEITIANSAALDFETTPVFNLTVQVEDSGTLTDTAAVTISLNDLNETPVVNNQSFAVNENAANGTSVGNVAASDPDAGDALSYSITGGNTGAAFIINAGTGEITVANSAALDFETTPVFNLTVQVKDSGTLTDTATVTINLNDVNETPVLNNQAFAVNENAANGTSVGTVLASDPDAGDLFTYSITAGNTNGAFAINTGTGEITVANSAALDFETTPVFNLTVQVEDSGTLTDTATVTVNLNDLNDAPVITSNGGGAAASVNVAENSTAITTATATDSDVPVQTLSYAVSGGADAALFSIDSGTGVLTVNTPRDFENPTDADTDNVYDVTVQVSDGNGGTDTQAISVTVTDGNETPVVNNQGFAVNENAANGTSVGTVAASDPDAGDTLTYSITAGNTNGAFAINTGTGEITVANSAALDFETTPVFNLTVQVEDNGTLTDTATVTINLNDLKETPAVNNQSFTVNENAANGTSVGTVAASDPDAGDSLTYSITAGNTGGAFTINAGTGEITVANSAALDFETTPVFNLTVQVEDNGALTDTATVTINLNDVNETPVLNNQSFAVNENAANGTSVGALLASDPDAGDSLTYSITAGNTGGAFTINAGTGEITVANNAALDFETTPVFNLTVQVEDNGTLADTATVTINLNDLNETPMVNNQSFAIDENSANGTSVGTVAASDPDAGDSLTYSITAGNTNGAFTINAGTGEITVANSAALDFETTPVFNLTVQVEDSGTLADTATVTINLNVQNETPVVNNQSFGVNENAPNGTSVGTVAASDPDAGDPLTYSITAGNTNGTFTINAGTGEITVANSTALDFETTPMFNLTVQVEDSGTLTDTATVTINLNGLNESPTALTLSNTRIDEQTDTTGGYRVGMLTAHDPDAGEHLSYSIVGGADAAYFRIDGAAGNELLLDDGLLDFESQAGYDVLVRITDAGGLSRDQLFHVTVQDLAEEDPAVLALVDTAPDSGEPAQESLASPPSSETDASADRHPDPGAAAPASAAGAATEQAAEAPAVALNAPPPDDRPFTGDGAVLAGGADEQGERRDVPAPRALPYTTLLAPKKPLAQAIHQALATPSDLSFAGTDWEDYRSILEVLTPALDHMGSDLTTPEDTAAEFTATGIMAMSLALSFGFAAWVLRAGSLMTSLLSTMPLWRELDPLSALPVPATPEKKPRDPAQDHKNRDDKPLARLFATSADEPTQAPRHDSMEQ